MAHIRQSRQDSGPDFQVKFIELFLVVPYSLGIGSPFTGNGSYADDP